MQFCKIDLLISNYNAFIIVDSKNTLDYKVILEEASSYEQKVCFLIVEKKSSSVREEEE
jgi:hypothetical protein